MRTARNQPAVEVTIDKVGIRISVRGISPEMMARRVSSDTPRKMGPMTKPMNRSIPVHSAPVMTCTKFRNQRLGLRIAAIIAAKAAAAARTYLGLSGAVTRTGCVASAVFDKTIFPYDSDKTVMVERHIAKRAAARRALSSGQQKAAARSADV